MLRYCVKQEAYVGCDIPELGDEIIVEGDLDIGIEDDIHDDVDKEDVDGHKDDKGMGIMM